MEFILSFAKEIIQAYGYLGVFVLTTLDQFILPIPVDVFIPFGVSFGLNFTKMFMVMIGAIMVGAAIGYALGKYLGHPAAVWLFGQKRLQKGEDFIKKWGIWGVMLTGIIPFPFKIVTWVAGIFEMPFYKLALGMLMGLIPRYFVTAFATTLFIKTKFYASTEISAVILGIFQGVTEFLPISSSGHLIIMEQFLKLPLGPLDLALFDIFLHGGSLLAILIYFWRDWIQVFKDFWLFITTRKRREDSLFFELILGTIPAILAGLAFGPFITGPLRNVTFIGIAFIGVALYFLFVEWKISDKPTEPLNLKKAVLVGLAQAVALLPGVSRSGMTIGAGMLTGLKRDTAAKFSFMLGAVAILAANVYALVSLGPAVEIPKGSFILIGFISAFVASLLTIVFLIRFLRTHTLRPFALYLILIGAIILSFLS